MFAALLADGYVAVDSDMLVPIISAIVAGYAALGGTLVWALKNTSSQLYRANTQYIAALQTTVAESNKTSVLMVERLTEVVTTVREMAAISRNEHAAMISSMAENNRTMLDALGKVGRNASSNT